VIVQISLAKTVFSFTTSNISRVRVFCF